VRVPKGPVLLSSLFSVLISDLCGGELVTFADDMEQTEITGTRGDTTEIKKGFEELRRWCWKPRAEVR